MIGHFQFLTFIAFINRTLLENEVHCASLKLFQLKNTDKPQQKLFKNVMAR